MSPTTKDKIIDAAIMLFWKQSYGSVSVDDICKAADVKKGSFYHFFPSKVDLVIMSFEVLWTRHKHFLDQAFSAAQTPYERLQTYAALCYSKQKELADEHGQVLGCPYAACGNELCTQEEKIRQKVIELFDLHTQYFKTLLEDAKSRGECVVADPASAAQEMFSYATGVMYQAKLKNDVEIIRRDLLKGLLRYLNTRQASAAQEPYVTA